MLIRSFIFFVLMCAFNADANQVIPIPSNLIGKKLVDLGDDASDLIRDEEFEGEYGQNQYLIIWKGEWFFRIITSNYQITDLIISSSRLRTSNGIKTGVSLELVKKSYPNLEITDIYNIKAINIHEDVVYSFGFDMSTLKDSQKLPVSSISKFQLNNVDISDAVLTHIRVSSQNKREE